MKHTHTHSLGLSPPSLPLPLSLPPLLTRWVPDAQTWLPAKPPSSKPQFVGVVNAEIASRNDGLTVNESKPYSGGIGGPCEVFSPPFSYWCSAHPAGGGGFQYYVPSGMVVANGTFPNGCAPTDWAKKGKGATVQAYTIFSVAKYLH